MAAKTLIKAGQTLTLNITLEAIAAERERRRKEADIVDWAERRFYIPETGEPIKLAPYQKAVLRYVLSRDAQGRFPFTTVVWSQIKKSGKTAIAGTVGRWAAETWGKYTEVYCLGNDAKQARTRAFAAIRRSIELTPGYSKKREMLGDEWAMLQGSATHQPTGSTITALAVDAEGEAGGNPSLTLWTEVWGITTRAGMDFWAEMTPSPARLNSMRWVETYAGFEGESEILWGLYESTVLKGHRLTVGEMAERSSDVIGAFHEAPNPDDKLPCYVDSSGSIFAFWDTEDAARRMPWQQGERGAAYYAAEESTLLPAQYQRLHRNLWASPESSFIEIAWWDACLDPLPLKPGDKTPLVIGLDAAVTRDCFALTVVSRDPTSPSDSVALRMAHKWTPPEGGKLSFDEPRQMIRWLAQNFNVTCVTFDPCQLHDFTDSLKKEGVAWFREFPQGADRLQADKLLYDLIVSRRIRHDGNQDIREHLTNANAKIPANEDNKLRIVKKTETRKIDLAVSLSMAAYECLRLNLV